MGFENISKIKKPKDWPANAIECQLDNILNQVNKFKMNPNYRNKEALISLVSDYDLNQRSMIGLIRTTDYEVASINSIYLEVLSMQINAIKTYLYNLIGYKTRIQKMKSQIFEDEIEILSFGGLLPPLYLYYITYQKFNIEKKSKFSECLVEIVENEINLLEKTTSEDEFKEFLSSIEYAYTSLLNDISYFGCLKINKIWAFTREEIYKLFNMAGKIMELNSSSPNIRPLKGVLMTSISNYILKSRNNYNEEYICKYISPEAAKKSIGNHQIWMSEIERLNDKREKKVIPELFEENQCISHSWIEDIDFKIRRNYYVSSFCKSIDNPEMKKDYGSCIYGYKDDRMVEILAPILYRPKDAEKKYPILSQVIAFDVLYDREEAKEEIEFLCNVLDSFNMGDSDKKSFLEEILEYWILSVKDPKWKHEKERRYVLFMYDEYNYIEIDRSDSRFLKLKTSLFIQPDFILGENPEKPYIRKMIDNKREVLYTKPYLFCENCLNRDFDVVAGGIVRNSTCAICGLDNTSVKNSEEERN